MISIIVCSINPAYASALKENIDANIGVEYEWLVWDNRQAGFGLSQVYNMLAEESKYPYLCFVHEDVLINTKIWGAQLLQICKTGAADLIGVAGGKYKSNMFSGWYSGGKNLDYYSLIHRTNGKEEQFIAPANWPSSEVKVATIDGVFMFSKRSAWERTRFNDSLLKGFHYYDIDFSLRVAQQGKVVVSNRLELTHFSKGGDFGDKWVNETIIYHNRLGENLPFSVEENVQANIDIVVAKYWLDWLKNMKISWGNRVKWIGQQKLYAYPNLFYGILKFLLYRPLRLQKLHHIFKKERS